VPSEASSSSIFQRTPVMIGVGVAAVVAFVLLGYAFTERTREVDELRTLSEEVQEARVVADSCRRALVQQESDFHRFDRFVDSLRSSVDAYEGLDDRGVPRERYQEYLETFDGYNEAVARWDSVADSLRRSEASCRTLIQSYNALADSFRARLDSAGVEGAS